MKKIIITLSLVFGLSACEHVANDQSASSAQSGRYKVSQDYSPDVLLDPNKIQDAVPREEYVTKAGNKSPYTVLGKTYTVLPSAKGYRGEGGASWYGLKFHGYKTSNGETYDIYQMTAAHKTLPIPCYVKVTNKANGRSVIVRVNDRGPFHEGRIIDLSYAAATKLGYINTGTAQVIVEAIDVREWQANSSNYSAIVPVNMDSEIVEDSAGASAVASSPVVSESASYEESQPVSRTPVPANYASTESDAPLQPGYIYLQVGAYVDPAIANNMVKKLQPAYSSMVKVDAGRDQYYRVRLGPVSEQEVDRISADLQQSGFPMPMRVK